MLDKIQVTGPQEILKVLAEKLKENGFKQETVYMSLGARALYIEKDCFYLGGNVYNILVDKEIVEGFIELEIYNVLDDWEYLSSLTPKETEPKFSEEDWVWVKAGSDKALVKWSKNEITYGFNYNNLWTDGFYLENSKKWNDHKIKKATKNEVENHLKQEAVKRGFVEGAIIDNTKLDSGYVDLHKQINVEYYKLGYYPYDKSNIFFVDGHTIMENGKWAEIVEDKKSKNEFTTLSSNNKSLESILEFDPNNQILKIDLNKNNITIDKTEDNILTININKK